MTLLLPIVCLFACALSVGFEAKQQNKLALKTKLLASLTFVLTSPNDDRIALF